MATIDKPLPNINEANNPEDKAVEIETVKSAEVVDTPTGPVEVDMTEDGGAEISFDPNTSEIDPNQDHFAKTKSKAHQFISKIQNNKSDEMHTPCSE